jgi:hypothetical protein
MDLETKLDLLLIELQTYGEMINELERDMVNFNEWIQTELAREEE